MKTSTESNNDVRVTIRVDKDLKERAEILFDRLGMNMSTALNVFLRKAVDEEAIPFTISTKSTVFGSCKIAGNSTNAIAADEQSDVGEKQQNESQVSRTGTKSNNTNFGVPDVSCEYVYKYGKPVV